ncbi:hypothetical protein MauCBS54593_005597 [Microsporum audouinii]
MAGYPPPGQNPYPPHGGPPPQGYPPQGYQGHPPQGQYPPPQHGQYPPQGHHPPQGHYPPQGHHPPPGGAQAQYYAPQGHPPQGQYPQGQYGAPRPGAPPYGYPPQGPPQGQYPPPQQGHYPPPQHGYAPQGHYPPQGHHPQPGYGAAPSGPPAQPSPGYAPGQMAQGDASREADSLRKAMKGFGTDELTLIEILSKPDALRMALICHTFYSRHKRNLDKDIEKECGGKFRDVMLALVRGPLMQDVYAVNKAIKGMGTNERLLNDVLLSRSNADMNAIKTAYKTTFGRTLEADVRGDLSMQTEQFFNLVLAATRAEENTPPNQYQHDQDMTQMWGAMGGNTGVPKHTVWHIITQRSDAQIRAISEDFPKKYNTALSAQITSHFSGHIRDALVHIVSKAVRPVLHDVLALEDTMAGMGTNDCLLIERLVRIHWNRHYMEQVKDGYMKKYGKPLRSRVASETRGDYEKALLAILQ